MNKWDGVKYVISYVYIYIYKGLLNWPYQVKTTTISM